MPAPTKAAPRGRETGAVPADADVSVLSVASEMVPWVKTGGLADVVGALPGALAPVGVALRTLLPGYPAVMAALREVSEVAVWPDHVGGPARLLAARAADARLLVLDAPPLYDRPGNPYLDANGRDWPDNALRFAALAAAAARIGWGEAPAFRPQVLHLHDWQAALVPAYLHFLGAGRPRPATALTLHNMAFQGQFPATVFGSLGFPGAAFSPQGLEYHGDVGFLKSGLLFADAITTVSPTYAREILQPAAGMGLDPILRWRSDIVQGIVNGIDTALWDPATDPRLARPFSVRSLAQRPQNKRALEARFGLPPGDGPLLCMISRLTTQKGIDLVVAVLDDLVADGARLVVLGDGDAGLKAALQQAAVRFPAQVAVQFGYDEGLAHLMQGGSDAILIPSRFEPCGLTQLYGLRYGCVPLVSRVGGLADTVVDANHAALQAGVATGVQFGDISPDGLREALRALLALYRQPEAWRRVQKAGMQAEVGWTESAAQYARLYRRLAAGSGAAG